MRKSPFWWVLIGFLVLIDFYFFQAIKVVSQSAGSDMKIFIFTIYWVFSAAAIITLLILPYLHFERQAKLIRTTIFAVVAGLFFAKLIASLFFFVDDVRRVVQWASTEIFISDIKAVASAESEGIARSLFLSWAGLLAGSGLFGSLVFGFGNKYRYQLNRIPLSFDNLPNAFKGLKVLHISDIHCGSFNNKEAVLKGVQKAMDQKPDIILFTGDMVNNVADEMDGYMDVFSQLKAPLGVYSVLGNHDYGDYANWDSPEAKKENLEKLMKGHADLGWKLLMNERITIEKDGDSIALIGIENWSGKARFPKYGDLKKAYNGSASQSFKILMSHDPSHWEAEVVRDYPDIDLMLSGHTHGMQFGVEIPWFRWSPVQYVYKHWAGLYERGKQKLYVNRGFGFIGYPGRVGILPEITVLQLN